MSCWAVAHPSSALDVGFCFLLLIKTELTEDRMLGAAEEAGSSMPHWRVVSLCASDERLFLWPPLGCQTCISEVLMRPSALASSGVSPLFSVLLTAQSRIPKAGKKNQKQQSPNKTKQKTTKKMQTIRISNYTRLSAAKTPVNMQAQSNQKLLSI